MFNDALALYSVSFPIYEQRKLKSQLEVLSEHDYHFNLIIDKDIFVGFILYWETNEFRYIEHLAINPALRNSGYGCKALEILKKEDKTIILEIDPPTDEISIRRKGFYERIGFKANQYKHVHPPYIENENGHELVIMTYPSIIDNDIYKNFNEYLCGKVMNKPY